MPEIEPGTLGKAVHTVYFCIMSSALYFGHGFFYVSFQPEKAILVFKNYFSLEPAYATGRGYS